MGVDWPADNGYKEFCVPGTKFIEDISDNDELLARTITLMWGPFMLKDMTEGSETRHILAFTMPLFIGNVFQQAYNMVDAVIVGRYIGQNALAAVGTSFPVLYLMISFVLGLTVGASVIISQLFGAKDYRNLKRAISTFIFVLLATAVGISLIGLIATRPLLALLRTPEEIIQDAASYMMVTFAGTIFLFGYNAISGVLRGLGDSRTPLYFLILSSILNIYLDILFVKSFGMGVAGAAYATMISQALSMIFCAVYAYTKIELFHFSLRDWVFDKEIFKNAIKLGIPASIQQMLMSMGMMAMQGFVNSFGSVTMAAFTAAGRVDSIAVLPIQSYGMALSTFTAQNVGANRFDRVKKAYRATLVMVLLTCLLAAMIMTYLGNGIISMFIKGGDQEVIRQGAQYLAIISVFYVFAGIMFVTTGMLRGAGDMIPSSASTLVSLVVRVITAYILSMFTPLGYLGIWWAIPVGWVFGLAVALFRYKQGGWKSKAVVANAYGAGR